MGKRKKAAKKPQGPRRKEPLATTFSCLFCNHEASVSVRMDKKSGTGALSCKVCGQQFQTGINYLSAAVDVYSDWVDACDTVAKETAQRELAAEALQAGAGQKISNVQLNQRTGTIEEDDMNDDDAGYDD